MIWDRLRCRAGVGVARYVRDTYADVGEVVRRHGRYCKRMYVCAICSFRMQDAGSRIRELELRTRAGKGRVGERDRYEMPTGQPRDAPADQGRCEFCKKEKDAGAGMMTYRKGKTYVRGAIERGQDGERERKGTSETPRTTRDRRGGRGVDRMRPIAAYVHRRRRDNVTYSAARLRTTSVIPGNEREREQ